tara:strand:+ start:389 stop:1246 length:858 start_codon:yes stop_codon:yes gene_type:complete
MKPLIFVIAKIELMRLKTKIWLLFALLLGFSATIGCQEGIDYKNIDFTNVDINFQTSSSPSSSSSSPKEMLDLDYQKLFAAAPLVGAAGTCIILGFLVLLTMPFRGSEDRRLGCLQLLWLSSPSFPRIEAIRYLLYFFIGATFFTIVTTIGGVYGSANNLIDAGTAIQGIIVLAFWFFSALALSIALGGFITSLSSAYLNCKPTWPINLLSYLGIIGSISIFIDLISSILSNHEIKLLPVIQVAIGHSDGYQVNCPLPLDWLGITLSVSTLLVVWTGRIYTEMEI